MPGTGCRPWACCRPRSRSRRRTLLDGGVSYWVHALGVPQDVAAAGEVYSLTGLCHVYRDPTLGILSRYTTTGRAPSGVTSTEVRTAVSGSPPNQSAALLLVGVAGQTIDVGGGGVPVGDGVVRQTDST